MLKIKQGGSTVITDTITGLSSLSGYSAKLYIYNGSTLLKAITGSISGLIVTYLIVNEDSKGWTPKRYSYETKLYDSSDHVHTPSEGIFKVMSALVTDPS